MKKNNSKAIFLIIGSLFVIGLMLATAVVAVFAYRQFTKAEVEESQVDVAADALRFEVFSEGQGVVILSVDPDSPAAEAGLKEGDVILAVDGETVDNPEQLREVIKQFRAGDEVTLSLKNGEATRDVTVTLESAGPYLGVNIGGPTRFHDRMVPFPDENNPAPDFQPEPFDPHFPGLPDDHPFFSEPHHLLTTVMMVVPDSPADEAGIMVGDRVKAINDQEVENREQIIDAIAQLAPGDEVEVVVERAGDELTFVVTLDSHPDDPDRGFLGVQLGIIAAPFEQFFGEPGQSG